MPSCHRRMEKKKPSNRKLDQARSLSLYWKTVYWTKMIPWTLCFPVIYLADCELEDKAREVDGSLKKLMVRVPKEGFLVRRAWRLGCQRALSVPMSSGPAAIRSAEYEKTPLISILTRKQNFEVIDSKFWMEHMTTQEDWTPWHRLRDHWNEMKQIAEF